MFRFQRRGFRKGRSTVDALFVLGQIHRNLRNKTKPVSYTHLDVYKRQL